LRQKIVFILVIFLFIPACATHFNESVRVRGVYHRVKNGETLWRIARTYNVDIQDLAEINNMTDSGLIKADSIIFVPGVYQAASAAHPMKNSETPVKQSLNSSKKMVSAQEDIKRKTVFSGKRKKGQHSTVRFDKKRFIWPVKGKVVSRFGIQRSGMKYNGINISAREGTPVVAAAGGTVSYSAQLRYFGDTIIIKHKDRYATVYACLKGRKVKAGDSVKKGEQIALLGKPENSSRPYVHFEIRRRNKARNPLFFLP
jgi:murein DD-endopeptidase MepM/ murein hydrolase activator NlpD